MRRIGFPLLAGLLGITLQTTVFMVYPLQRIRPDLMLGLTLYLGLAYPPVSGGFFAFCLGFMVDLFSGNSFGLYAFSRLLLFYVTQLVRRRFFLEGFLSQSLFAFLFTMAEGFFVFLLFALFKPYSLHLAHLPVLTALFPQAILTGLATPVVVSLLARGHSLLLKEEDTGPGRGA
jgi:rod shape-determining protein MreD